MKVEKERAERGRIIRTLIDDNGHEVRFGEWVLFFRNGSAQVGRFLGWRGAMICIGPAMDIGVPVCIQVRSMRAIEAIEPVRLKK